MNRVRHGLQVLQAIASEITGAVLIGVCVGLGAFFVIDWYARFAGLVP